MRLEHSRTVRLAATAAGQSESRLERRLERALVSVSVDRSLRGGFEAAALLLETLRRGPGRIELDTQGLEQEQVVRLLKPAERVSKLGVSLVEEASAGAIRLRIGRSAPLGTPCVLPDGHGVRLASDGGLLAQRREPSSLGVAFSAAIAAGEAFKRTAELDANTCLLPERLSFCPVTLGEDLEVAPIEADSIELGLVGLGAIGTAVARILALLGFRPASALLIDPECFAAENLGTYSLGTIADLHLEKPKVDLAAAVLDGWSIDKLLGPVEAATGMVDAGELPWRRVVIGGLDSIEARHAAQSLWPDTLIDAATGDTSVGLHEARSDGPCLRCFFPEPASRASSAKLLADELGLPVELLMRGEEKLKESQIAGLSRRQRERLAPHLGKPICGLARAIGLGGDANDTYRPSVPFVSQQAACLAVGRLLAIRAGLENLPNAVQYNALIGPQQMTRMTRRPRAGCYCQQRAEVIRAVRLARGAGTGREPVRQD